MLVQYSVPSVISQLPVGVGSGLIVHSGPAGSGSMNVGPLSGRLAAQPAGATADLRNGPRRRRSRAAPSRDARLVRRRVPYRPTRELSAGDLPDAAAADRLGGSRYGSRGVGRRSARRTRRDLGPGLADRRERTLVVARLRGDPPVGRLSNRLRFLLWADGTALPGRRPRRGAAHGRALGPATERRVGPPLHPEPHQAEPVGALGRRAGRARCLAEGLLGGRGDVPRRHAPRAGARRRTAPRPSARLARRHHALPRLREPQRGGRRHRRPWTGASCRGPARRRLPRVAALAPGRPVDGRRRRSHRGALVRLPQRGRRHPAPGAAVGADPASGRRGERAAAVERSLAAAPRLRRHVLPNRLHAAGGAAEMVFESCVILAFGVASSTS